MILVNGSADFNGTNFVVEWINSFQIGWNPLDAFAAGIRTTVEWFLSNSERLVSVHNIFYGDWCCKQYKVTDL